MENNQSVQNKRQEDELVIDLGGIAYDLWKKLPFIVLVTVFMAVAGFVYSSFFITPMYESSTSMYVSNTQDETKTTYSDLQSSSMISTDYAQMIKSRIVLEAVIEKLELDMTTAGLSNEIEVDMPGSERIIVVTVTDADPILAMEIADTVREVAAEHIKNVMGLDAVNTVDYANLPTVASSPNIKKNTLLAALIGLVAMCGIFAFRFILNDSIRTPEDIDKRLGLSVLAVVPTDKNIKTRKNKDRKGAGK